jgi:hypothetical protein
MSSVTDYDVVRIGYRIYSLWRFTITDGYSHCDHYSTGSFLNPADGTALRWRLTSESDRFWLRRLTDED